MRVPQTAVVVAVLARITTLHQTRQTADRVLSTAYRSRLQTADCKQVTGDTQGPLQSGAGLPSHKRNESLHAHTPLVSLTLLELV